jgi:hypothetical protein
MFPAIPLGLGSYLTEESCYVRSAVGKKHMPEPPESRKGTSREIFIGLIVAIVGGLFVWWITEFLHNKSLESAIDCSSDDFQSDGLLMKKGDKYQREGHWKQARQCYEKAVVEWNGRHKISL